MSATRYGIIGLVAALLIGGVVMLNSGEKNVTYVCPATGQIGVFYGGLSSSGERAYPYDNTTTGYKDCKYSNNTREKWVTCTDYLKAFNASCVEPIIPVPVNNSFSCQFSTAPSMTVIDPSGWNAWQFNHTNDTMTILLTNSSYYNITTG
jgi:hypothetical protein